MEEIEETEGQIESIEDNIEVVKNAENFIDKGKAMVKDLNGLKHAIFSEDGKEYIKEGKALVKVVGALTETGLNTVGSESAQYSKHSTNNFILLM